MVGLMEPSSKRAYAIPRSAASRAPALAGLTCTSTGDTQTLKGRSGSVSVGSPSTHKVLFEPSKHLWWVWGLILNVIWPLLPSFWGFSFAIRCGVSFFGGIQYSPVNDSSAASCNFGVLTGEVERTSFYSTTLFDNHKRCPFHYRGLECKSRKSTNTWSNRKIWLWSTK